MPRRKKEDITATFANTLREALDHFQDPEWLGEHSPLATPYFLGQQVQQTDGSAQQRGQVLRQAILQASATLYETTLPADADRLQEEVEAARIELGNAGAKYHFYLLEVRYLRQYIAPTRFPFKVFSMPDFVNVSSSRFFIHLENAVEALGNLLLQQIQPTFRLEAPQPSNSLLGRDTLQQTCLRQLQAKQAVSLSGISGVGKTTLATAVAQSFHTFWYTFRPSLNDQLGSLLFAIGHFLQQQGVTGLWLHLVANSGKPILPEQALGFLRDDLAQLPTGSLLFCLDEVDILLVDVPAHQAILEFLESLKGLVSLLFVGQMAPLDTPVHHVVEGLTLPQMKQLLAQWDIHLPPPQQARLHEQTQGNPRLLELFAVLHEAGESVLALGRNPAVRPLLNRVWKRLSAPERDLLEALSVFRGVVPLAFWSAKLLAQLQARRLVQLDGLGGVQLLPVLRQLLYEELLPEQREMLHAQAGRLRMQVGEFTASAYHWVQAGEVKTAVSLWYSRRAQEIQRGQADAARVIFASLNPSQLKGRVGKQLKLLQNELHELLGDAHAMLQGMDVLAWEQEPDLAPTAYKQWGVAHMMQGDLESAVERYEVSLQALAQLTQQAIEVRVYKGRVLRVQGVNMQAEVNLMQYEVARFQGVVALMQGVLPTAVEHLQTARTYAEKVGKPLELAVANRWLMLAYGQQGQIEQATKHGEDAVRTFQKLGHRLQAEGARAEMASMYIQVGQYEQVITPAEQALSYFEKVNHDGWISTTCSNLAEAYLETGNLDKAKSYAFRVLQREDGRTRPYALYTLGLVHQRQERPQESQVCFQEGIAIAQQNNDQFIEAYLWRELGRLLHDEKALQTAVDLFNAIGLPHEAQATGLK